MAEGSLRDGRKVVPMESSEGVGESTHHWSPTHRNPGCQVLSPGPMPASTSGGVPSKHLPSPFICLQTSSVEAPPLQSILGRRTPALVWRLAQWHTLPAPAFATGVSPRCYLSVADPECSTAQKTNSWEAVRKGGSFITGPVGWGWGGTYRRRKERSPSKACTGMQRIWL